MTTEATAPDASASAVALEPLDTRAVTPVRTDYKVDLNTADVGTLSLLPGIGPALAQRLAVVREFLSREVPAGAWGPWTSR